MSKKERYQIVDGMFVYEKDFSLAKQYDKMVAKMTRAHKFYSANDELFDKFAMYFYMGIPLARLYDYSSGRCFATALSFSMCFDDCKYVIADLRGVASKMVRSAYFGDDENAIDGMQYEANETQRFAPSFMHAFLLVGGKELARYGEFRTKKGFETLDEKKEYVVDFSLGFIMAKDDYYKTYSADEKFVFTKEDLCNCPAYVAMNEYSQKTLKRRLTEHRIDNKFEDFKTFLESVNNSTDENPVNARLKSIINGDFYNMAQRDDNINEFLNEVLAEGGNLPLPNYDFLPKEM